MDEDWAAKKWTNFARENIMHELKNENKLHELKKENKLHELITKIKCTN